MDFEIDDIIDLLMRLIGGIEFLFIFFNFFIISFNSKKFNARLAQSIFNHSVKYNFKDYVLGNSLEKKIGKKNHHKFIKKLDIKTYFKLQKKVYILTKLLLNKNSRFMFKLLTKNFNDKKHFNDYFRKECETIKINIENITNQK